MNNTPNILNQPFVPLGHNKTTEYLTKEMMVEFISKFKILNCINLKSSAMTGMYDGARPGTRINLQRATFTSTSRGLSVENNVDDIINASVPLVLGEPYNKTFRIDMVSEKISVWDVKRDKIDPCIEAFADELEASILEEVYPQFMSLAGTPGDDLSAETLAEAGAILSSYSIPTSNRNAWIPDDEYVQLAVSNSKLFNQLYSTPALKDLEVQPSAPDSRFLGIDCYQSNQLPHHTNGSWAGTGDITVSGTYKSNFVDVKEDWVQSITLSGFANNSANVIHKGDKFTIDGLYSVSPVLKKNTGRLQVFTAQENASSNGTGVVTVKISPYIVVADGDLINNANATVAVDGTLPTNPVVDLKGEKGATYRQTLVWHRDALVVANPQAEVLQGIVFKTIKHTSGFNFSVMASGDIRQGYNVNRITCLLANRFVNPFAGVIIYGKKV